MHYKLPPSGQLRQCVLGGSVAWYRLPSAATNALAMLTKVAEVLGRQSMLQTSGWFHSSSNKICGNASGTQARAKCINRGRSRTFERRITKDFERSLMLRRALAHCLVGVIGWPCAA